MKPCALWRCIGSTQPGGYSTVIIMPSLPGNSARSFEKSVATLASLFSSVAAVTAMTHTNIKLSFVIVIRNLSLLCFCLSQAYRSGCAGSAELASIWLMADRCCSRGGLRIFTHVLPRGLLDPGFETYLAKSGVFAGDQRSLTELRT